MPGITERRIRALKPGATITDDLIQGFRARRQRDNVVFEIRYRDTAGKRRTYRIGSWQMWVASLEDWPFPVLDEEGRATGKYEYVHDGRYFSLSRARAEARKLTLKLAARQDPRLEAGPEGLTLDQALARHIRRLRKANRSEVTVWNYTRNIENHLSEWLKLPLRQITRPMAREHHDEITAKAGKHAANDTFRAFRAVWNQARREDEELGVCPTVAVDWNSVTTGGEALLPEQLSAWYERVQRLRNPILRDYYILVLFTGLRRRSAASLRWEDVDFLRKTLRIPKPKGGERRAFTLPLSDFLVELLERRKADNEKSYPKSPWVFPSKSASGHFEEVKVQRYERRGKKLIKVKDETMPSPHALRRTFIAVCEHRVGLPLLHTKLLVNHSVPRDVTLMYAGASDLEALRESMQRTTDYLLKCFKPGGAEVVPLHQAEHAI